MNFSLVLNSCFFVVLFPTLCLGSGNFRGCLQPDEVDNSGKTDYFPDKISPLYSKYWNITYHNTYKIVHNLHSDTKYLLYQCGTSIPALSHEYDLVVEVPLQDGVAVSSSTQIPQLEQLGVRRQIKASIGQLYTSSPCIQTMEGEGLIAMLNTTTLPQYLIDHPDLVVIKSYDEAGDRSFVVSEAQESDGKAIYEWHKVYGALFNSEKLANEQFDASVSRYDCASENAAFISRRAMETSKPTVLWGFKSNYENEEIVHVGWDVAECDPVRNYYCDYADRCEANLLHSSEGSTGHAPYGNLMTDEEFLTFAKEADIWIYTGFQSFSSLYEDNKSMLNQFKSVQNGEVYAVNQNGWFEQRLAEYDVVLQDFCDAVGHYDDLNFPHNRMWLSKVMPFDAPEPFQSFPECNTDEIDNPWESRASVCTILTAPTNPPSAAPFSTKTNLLIVIIAIIASAVSLS